MNTQTTEPQWQRGPRYDDPSARPVHRRMPYGLWTTETEEVLFDRDYYPIWRRSRANPTAGRRVTDRPEINFIGQDWFYTDNSSPDHDEYQADACKEILGAFVLGEDVRDWIAVAD